MYACCFSGPPLVCVLFQLSFPGMIVVLTVFILQEIEETLSSKFDPAADTLGTLQDLNAFEHSAALEEISGKASSEANLETMLKKVTQL